MNKRLKELAEQAGLMCTEDVNADGAAGILLWFKKFDLERFAELVRQDEREACAKLCTEMGNRQTNQSLLDPWDCASSIRARSDK